MKTINLVYAFAAAVLVAVGSAPPAFAAFDTYVSAGGSDAAACTIAAPCLTMQKAVTVTNPLGFLHCLDDNDNGSTLNITQSITIDCSGTNAGASNFTINGAGIVVHLRGLQISFGAAAIDFQQGAALYVENCDIVILGGASADGILFRPSNKGAELYVTNSIIHEASVGIHVEPQSGGQGFVNLDGVKLIHNTNEGLRVSGASGGAVQATIRNSVASYNGTQGFAAVTVPGGKGVVMKIDSSEASFNNGDGVRANQTTVFVGGSTVWGNNAFGFNPVVGGTITSYGNNINGNNTTNGAPTSTISLQ